MKKEDMRTKRTKKALKKIQKDTTDSNIFTACQNKVHHFLYRDV